MKLKFKHLFWLTCVMFVLLAIKLSFNGERYVVLLIIACAIASAFNAMRLESNRHITWADIRVFFNAS
jgi:hypothetical protein